MDSALYDEFGNYIGPDIDDEDENDEQDGEFGDYARQPALNAQSPTAMDADPPAAAAAMSSALVPVDKATSRAIILNEDRQYYASASEVYPEAETLVMDEDTQTLAEPIIAPIVTKNFHRLEKNPFPPVTFNIEFMHALAEQPELVRNVAVVGHLHHGKTTFVDMLIRQTHVRDWNSSAPGRYTDTLNTEQDRGVSIKAVPITLLMRTSRHKTYYLNIFDTPGHVNFSDEITAALAVADGVILVVDALEGVMMQTERVIKHACAQGLAITVVINKVDRLIVELKLPPGEAFFKLRHTIEEINGILAACPTATTRRVSPELGNVCFASGLHGWCFSLEQFARIYQNLYGGGVDPKEFAKRLWGDLFFEPETRKFVKRATQKAERSFVQFVFEPLYKIYSQVLGEEPDVLMQSLAELGLTLSRESLKIDSNPLLHLVLSTFFESASGLVDMLATHVPSPLANADAKTRAQYTGPQDKLPALAMQQCSPTGPVMLHAVKTYPRPDCQVFDVLARVYSGTIRVGDRVLVLGEGYSQDDTEESVYAHVTELSLPGARYRTPINHASAGTWVLIAGVEGGISKTATLLVAKDNETDHFTFRPLQFNTKATMRIAVEPLNPTELPKVLDGLRKINKTFPLCTTKVEESGEHVIIGTGELYLDCIMHDLRRMYADVEIKVADPVVSFCETVVETSSVRCFAETPNKQNKLTFIAEPMEKGLAEDIESGALHFGMGVKKMGDVLQHKYEWDLLATRSIWAFGPDSRGPNVLLDDTLSGEVDKKLVGSIKESVIQGFQWGTREGPLCEEPMRNLKFKLLSAEVSDQPLQRGGGQIIPTTRRAVYSSFLMATPRLMEPVYFVEIQAPSECVPPIYTVLRRRRGHVVHEAPKPGTPLYTVHAYIPVIDSIGFETDLRTHTSGQALCLSVFDHYAIVPGDPLDKTIQLRPLEPSPAPHLAREFMVKTRRRKGLTDDVTVTKFFDAALLAFLAEEAAAQ